jgi:hypothetical protein
LTALLVFLQDRTPVGRLYLALFRGFKTEEQTALQEEILPLSPEGGSS